MSENATKDEKIIYSKEFMAPPVSIFDINRIFRKEVYPYKCEIVDKGNGVIILRNHFFDKEHKEHTTEREFTVPAGKVDKAVSSVHKHILASTFLVSNA